MKDLFGSKFIPKLIEEVRTLEKPKYVADASIYSLSTAIQNHPNSTKVEFD